MKVLRRTEKGEAPRQEAATTENTGVFERGATQPAGMHRPSNAARLSPRAAGAGLAANARTKRKAANLIGATYVIHRRMAGRLGFAAAVIVAFLGVSTGPSSAQTPAADTAFEGFWSASSPEEA